MEKCPNLSLPANQALIQKYGTVAFFKQWMASEEDFELNYSDAQKFINELKFDSGLIEGFTGPQQQTIVKYFTATIIQNRKEGFSSRDLLTELFNDFKEEYKELVKENSIDEAIDIKKIIDNQAMFELLITQKLHQISEKGIDEDNFDQDEKGKEKNHNKEAYEEDPFLSTSPRLRKLFFMVKDVDEEFVQKTGYVGIPLYKEASEIIPKLQIIASTLTHEERVNTDLLKAALENKVSIMPWLRPTIDLLNESGERYWIEFAKFISKHEINMTTSLVDNRGKSVKLKAIDTNQNSIAREIVQSWLASQVVLPIVKEVDGNMVIDNNVRNLLIAEYKNIIENPTPEALAAWLSQIGVTLHPKVLNYIFENSKEDSRYFENMNFISLVKDKKGWFNRMYQALVKSEGDSENKLSLNNPLFDNIGVRKLADLQARFDPDATSTSFVNGENKTISTFSNNKYASIQFSRLQNPDYAQSMLESPFAANSWYLQMLAENNAEFKEVFSFEYADTLKIQNSTQDNKSLDQCTDAEYELFRLTQFANNKFLFPTMSDKKATFIMKTLTKKVNIVFNGNQFELSKDIVEEVFKTIESELDRNSVNYQNGVSGNQYIFNYPELNTTDPENPNFIPGLFSEENGRLITNDTEEVRASLLKWLNGKLKSEINNQVAEWKKLNIITENNEFKFMDADYLKKMGSHITNDTQKNIQVAADYVLNYYIFKHNMFQSFITDPLFYFKGNIEETWINIGKRLASENAPGYDLINVGKSEYRQAFGADPKMVSYSLDYYKKLGLSDDKIKDYSTIDGTDAQEYTTLQEHLYVMYHTGKLNEEDYKNLLNKANTPIKDGKPNDFTSEELGILQAMKPVYRETIIKNRLNRPIYIKTSSFPLIPQLTRGLEINNLRVAMEKGKVDRFVFKSGAKVGFPSKLTNVFGSDGEFLSDIEFLEDSIISLPRSGFRIQQEVPYNKDKQFVNTVTQADKLIVADLPARLEPTKQKYFELKKQIYQIHYDELVKELNLKETVDGYTYDIEKLSKLLIREGEARNYSTNDLKSLEVKNGKFVVPLLFNNSGLKVQSALMSIVDKKVRKLKMPGFSGILASEAGFKTQKDYKDLTAEQKSDIVFIDSKHDGLSHDEVLVPFKFRDDNGVLLNVKDFVKEDGTLDTTLVPKELLRLLGFRIPNQGKNSMLSIKIAGFLPSYMGDLIVASRDLTKQMGSDFDVDKLYVYMYNTKYDPSTKTISKYTIGDTVLVDENQEAAEIEEGDEDEIRNKKKTKGGREYEVQNEIIDIYHEILNDPEIMVQIKTPLGFGKLHDIKKKILAIKPKEELSPLSPKYDRKKYISARGGKAGTGVFSASNTLNAVIQDRGIYTTTIEVDEEGKAKKVEQILYLTEKSTRLSEREDVNGNLKSSTHSAFQSASVDEEKEQLLSSLNVNTYTFDFITGATQSGFDEEAICYLINQPVINEFINEVGNRTSVLSDVFDKNAEENVIYELIDKYTALAEEEYKSNSIVSLTDLENALSGDITVKNYYSTQLKAINKFAEFKEVGKNLKQLTSTISADSKGLSKDVISLVYKIDQVRNLSKMGGLMNAEKALGTFHKTQVEGSVRLDDGLYLVPETIPGMAVAYGSFTAYNMYKNLLPYEGADFKTTIDWVSKLSGRQLDTPTKLVDFTTKLSDVMRMYYFSSQDLGIYKEDVMLLRNRLLLGDDSLARRIAALQPTTTNKFIRRLSPVINTEADKISVLKFNAATRETMDEPEIHRAFAQLFIDENTRSLAEDIVSYAYLTGGVQMAVQYIKFIPFSYIKYSGMVSKLYDINSKLMYISTIPSQDTVFDNGAYPFVPNEVTQLLQSNPDYSYRIKDYKTLKNTSKIDGKLISFDVPVEALYATGELKGFPIEIVSVRQKDKTLALFQYDANTQKYNRIDNLGTFPIQEFNANGKGKSIVKNNITPVAPVSPITSQTYTPKPSIPLSNPYAGVNFLESMGLADDSTLSEQALDYIIEGADGYYSTLAKVLKENFDKLQGITIKLDNNLKARASWNYRTRIFTINPEEVKNDEERFKGTVIEELFHGLTAEILYNPKTDLQKKLANSITSLMEFVEKKVVEKYGKEAEEGIGKAKGTIDKKLTLKEFGLFYGLKNEREFVAQAFRNREFQKLLNSIDYGVEGKTLLDKFISLVKEALKSIGIEIKPNTALDAAVNQMFQLLEDEKIKPTINMADANWKNQLEIAMSTQSFVREYTPEKITKESLPENGIFVFGSNNKGVHGLGAAKTAVNEFGAKYGQASGLQGKAYAIRTKMYQDNVLTKYNKLTEDNKKLMDKMTIEDLNNLRLEAVANPDKKYYVTEIGTKLAGRTVEQMKDLFERMNNKFSIPDNIILPKVFEVRKDKFEKIPNSIELGDYTIIPINGTYDVQHIEDGIIGEYLPTLNAAKEAIEKHKKINLLVSQKTISSPIYKDAYGNFYKFDLLESDSKEMIKGYYSQGNMNDWKEMSNKTANNKFYDGFDELIEVVDKPEISVLSNEVNINGISINTGNIILNEQQLSSLQNIANFIDSLIKQGTWETTTFSLQGYAGTGKTTITRFIVQYLKKKGKNYTLSSPTHRAKEVLQDLTGEKAITVAKLLGLAPGVEVENFNLVDKQFQSKNEIKIPRNGIVIVDEASMVNDQLFDNLVELAAERGSKVLFIGDEAQLKPVKQKEKGKAFRRTSNITKLTQVMRTANGNPMPAKVLLPIRDNPTSKIDMFEHDDKLSPTGEGIKFVNNAKEWMASLLDKVSIENLTENPNLVRALAYTNKRVRELNTFIRAKMFGIGAEDFYKGELLMMYENLFWLPGGDYVYPNGMDVTIENVQYVSDFKINVPEKNRQVSVAGFMITTSKTKNKQKNIKDLFIADLDRVSSEYIKELVELKNKILNTPFAQRGPMWNKFYEFSDAYNLTDEVYFINDVAYSSRNEALKIARQLYPSMNQNQLDKIVNNSKAKDKSVDYAYAHTIHKSQGGTYDYSYVDEGNIDMARQFPNPDYEMINQLKYVGFSRSSKLTVSLTQKTQNTEIKTSPSQATLPSEEELREGIKKCSL